ncbi:VOC family protein [Microbulbifer sp. THAF38]|uniref:VOC family protein n=1 Tax=Microbulbifer sp. THAF38 TaxID=2587856 RepID=UPI0012AA2000|nr:VOC family protein [Microbulbifer sp. THAF38]QFT55785.1 hypothetical protein FIU95_14640 [Microbulbifer sp. THAF38]
MPFNSESASFGNGTMVALKAENEKEVDRIYCMALSLGAMSKGEPGHRAPGAFYGAYFRDLDGNKVAIFAR